jgi:hypothetical protein
LDTSKLDTVASALLTHQSDSENFERLISIIETLYNFHILSISVVLGLVTIAIPIVAWIFTSIQNRKIVLESEKIDSKFELTKRELQDAIKGKVSEFGQEVKTNFLSLSSDIQEQINILKAKDNLQVINLAFQNLHFGSVFFGLLGAMQYVKTIGKSRDGDFLFNDFNSIIGRLISKENLITKENLRTPQWTQVEFLAAFLDTVRTFPNNEGLKKLYDIVCKTMEVS